MQSTEVYSDSSCESPVTLTITSSASCTSSDCASTTIAGSTYYTATSCPSNIYSHAADVYDDTEYLLVDIYSGTDCNTYIESVAFVASGECQIAGTDGQSVIATLNSNGSAQVTYYLDGTCTLSTQTSLSLTEDDLTNHSCTSGRRYYSSSDGSATNGVSSSSSGSSSSSSSDSSGIGSGAIAGIIVGVIFVLVLVGILVYRRCHRRREQQPHRAPDFSQTSDLREAAYEAQASPAKPYRQTTITTTSDFDRRHSAKLWDDDVIVAARIPREKVKVKQLINRGGFGEVYIGSYHGKDVAVKMLLPETKKTMSQVNAFLSEVKLMASLDHPRIVSFIGVAWDQLIDICVVSEYMAGGDLKALLSDYEKNGHPVGFDHTKVKIALHVSIALTYLHSCAPPVIHRDLKSKNILLDEAMDAKVTDFGISRERIDATMTGGIGTSFWMAPEVMMGERYDDKADMFSFGVVLSELDSHVMPYALSKSESSTESSSSVKPNKLPNAAILQMVAAGRLRVHFSEAGPQSMVDLGLACVSLDPKERPTAAEALYKLQQILAKEV
ncbi:TKL protein kinase [Phytophthora nicotianae CJ01A1]|uniref:TKL protein kinase n=4 Tax=Phytophthora nicotianae TaxID=4792 RepID=W2QUF8_PHYN3|nr:TKL protein kinase [Phytophthora nicotianae INRA-310]ETK72012.1 TKL protein kinase [Phytophthora nicotianae]ETO60355.1 TKL protein kinase [Phytophthora nicotianae P1976]ETP01430.1 TKL protein kinase [Phytophthora nicotianae CJ01A1]KUF79376.1 serine/threonine-protein kinase drkA [Phytophthora nicotianae]ETL25435.1 TKL protein kinase [Phytophthora nicotianae]